MMIPHLHPADATAFTTLGIGSLYDARDMSVNWQLNGKYELTMYYPITGRHYDKLINRNIIVASVGPDEPAQPFRIYRVTKPLLGEVTVYARHVAYDLMGYTVKPFTASGLDAALAQLQSGAVTTAHPFAFAADFTSDVACTVSTPRAIWTMLGGKTGSLLDVYGRGEWDFDGFNATLRERLGADNGVEIRYAKNLKSLQQDENISNCWTAVQPYWADAEGNVVTLPEAIVSVDGEFDYTRILPLDLSAEWTEAPTEDALLARAERYISDNEVGKPSVSLDVGFVPLDQTEEYRGLNILSRIRKGDTVTVIFPTKLDSDTLIPSGFVSTSSRAVRTVWKPLLDRYESIHLGSVRASFADIVSAQMR